MLVLASASPRRQELLRLITPDFIVDKSDICEKVDIANPAELVLHLAKQKAQDVFLRHPADIVIGADTIVFAQGEALGKPADIADARRMIGLLEDDVHEVYTGVCVKSAKNEVLFANVTKVFFARMTEAEISEYLETSEFMDKAGAYAVQGEAAKFISRVEGCYYNVVGLPVNALYDVLTNHVF